MANCVQATINVQLTHALTLQNPDLTLDVSWDGRLEPISLVEIKFECPIGEEPRQAWFYSARGSPHRQNAFHAEIVTSRIENLQTWAKCRLHFLKGTYLI
jgi:hypothetical protein